MTNIEAMRKWLISSKLFSSTEKFNANFLDPTATGYSISDVPTSPVLKQFVDGSRIRAKNFLVAGRLPAGNDRKTNYTASGFWDALCDWIMSQNDNAKFPSIKGAQSVVVTNTGYVYSLNPDTNSAVYQIQISINYLQEE